MTVVVHTEHDALTAVLVQPLARGGIEVLVGIAQEAVFGPLVVFGLGGVATDLLGDHSARLSPLTDADARELIGSVRASATGPRSRAIGYAVPCPKRRRQAIVEVCEKGARPALRRRNAWNRGRSR